MALSATISDCQNEGSDFSCYYNVGTAETPIWIYHKGLIGDLNLGMVDDKNESSRRTGSNFKEYLPGRTDINFTGQQITDGNYEGNAVFNSAIKDGSPIDLLILTDQKDVQYSYGVRGEFYNFDRSISAPASGEQEQTFDLSPAACATTPVRYVMIDPADTVTNHDPTNITTVSTS